MGGFSIWHILILAAIALLLFGGRGKVSDLMGDFGKGINSFKKGLNEPDDADAAALAAAGHPARRDEEGHRPRSSGARARCSTFSWSHILILLIVALVVVGPKDLPRLMHIAGQLGRQGARHGQRVPQELRRHGAPEPNWTSCARRSTALRDQRPLADVDATCISRSCRRRHDVVRAAAARRAARRRDCRLAEARRAPIRRQPAP